MTMLLYPRTVLLVVITIFSNNRIYIYIELFYYQINVEFKYYKMDVHVRVRARIVFYCIRKLMRSLLQAFNHCQYILVAN